jgi:EAL domain-containing protein (putative c-di-GMP-specific phosphodiesterase class I)
LIGSEALLRWNHPQRGMVLPDQFIDIAEDSSLIVEIGKWVLREACQTAREWNAPTMPLHKVAINLSARQFQSGDLVETVTRILQETNCWPEWIELEITESMLLDEHGEVLEILNQLQGMGVAIAIDDFGTGYSSLSYLARYPINTLKIDRLFVSSIADNTHRAELVGAIISIAHSLGQIVVAEGVDTAEQAMYLRERGCQIAQGYLYSRPMPRAAFSSLLISFSQSTDPEKTGKWRKPLSLLSI